MRELEADVLRSDSETRVKDASSGAYGGDASRLPGRKIQDDVAVELILAVRRGPVERDGLPPRITNGQRVAGVDVVKRNEALERRRSRRESIIVAERIGATCVGVRRESRRGVVALLVPRELRGRQCRGTDGDRLARIRRRDQAARRLYGRREVAVESHTQADVVRKVRRNQLVLDGLGAIPGGARPNSRTSIPAASRIASPRGARVLRLPMASQ